MGKKEKLYYSPQANELVLQLSYGIILVVSRGSVLRAVGWGSEGIERLGLEYIGEV